MSNTGHPDYRLAPDARVAWSIPKQEWDAFVRRERQFVGLSIGTIGLLIGWVLMFLGFIGFDLWRLISISGGRNYGDGWLIIAATTVLFFSITGSLLPSALGNFRRMIAFRQRGELVWERHGCVCPTCLKPFDTNGRATCRHRVAACQQPTILRIFEAEATGDEPRVTELNRLLKTDSQMRAIASRGSALLRPFRRLNAHEPDAFPRPVRIAGFGLYAVAFIALFGIAAGWATIAWVPAIFLLGAASQFGQRARKHVHGRATCTQCGHMIDDLTRTSVCSECASDLSKIGSVRTANVELDQRFAVTSWILVTVAFAWGFYLAPLSVRVFPTRWLIAAINMSIGSIQGFSDELARRQLSTDESIAAANATLQWNARNPFSPVSTRTLVFVTAPETLSALSSDTVDALTEISVHPQWIVGERGATARISNGGRACVPAGKEAAATILFELGPRLPALALIVIRTTKLDVVRVSDQTRIATDVRFESRRNDQFRIQSDETTPWIPTATFAAGRYEITATYTVQFLPPSPSGWSRTQGVSATIDAAAADYPFATRTVTLTLDVE